MVTPYDDRAGITIYHGDCLDVVDDLAPHIGHQLFDLLLTDPPYGIGTWSATGGNSLPPDEVDQINRWDVAIDPVTLRRMIAVCHEAIIWGGNYYGDLLGRTRAPIVWDKAMRGMHFADGEMAWTNFQRGTLRISDLPIARGDTKGQRIHPTQKPEAVMRWCLLQAPKARTVFDPFMGSGTTLVAAKRLGLQATGIDRNESYCELAARRLQQDALPLWDAVG